METKRHSFLARAAMTLLLTVFTTLTTWADTWPAYITNVVLVGGTEDEAQDAKSNYSGYTWCSQRLNEGKNADIIYIGYKTSSSADTNGDYITDFIIIDAGSGTEGHNPPYSLTFQGRTYYRCPAAGGDYFVNSNHGNLTSQAANGWNMYLYYTKNSFDDKRAVSSINITKGEDTKSGSIDCYYKDGTLHEADISLNRGVSGTPFVYMHINTTTKVNRPNPEPTTISGLTYNGSPLKLISSNYNNYNSGTVYYRVGTSGSYTSDVNNVTATNAGTYTIYYYSGESYYGNSSVDYAHTMTATIAKSPNNGPTVTCADALESVGPSPSLTGTNLSTGTITYKYATSQNGSYSATKPSTEGTYWVKATIAGDNNCNEYTTAAVSFKLKHDWGVHNTGNTADNAYVISTTEDLNLLSSRVKAGNTYQGKFFKLGGNIAFNKTTANNITPIGNSTYSFKGTFDGNGKTISGINISLSSTSCVGLFGNAGAEATIKNLKIDNSTIGGQSYVGAILGEGEYQTHITNCLVTSSVSVSGQQYYVGGIVGNKGTITGCASAASVSGNNVVGGIMGSGYQSTITNCIYTGSSVTSSGTSVGAIVGLKDEYTTLNYNYYTANLASKGCKGSDINGARKAVAINTADGVTVTPTGTATSYNISGITGYAGNNGIGYGGHLYAGATETVSLGISYANTYEVWNFIGYTDGVGDTPTALTHVSDNTYTLTMPETTVTVTPNGDDYWGEQADGRDGSQAHPYVITTTAGLNLLASNVNGGKQYQDTYFVLGDNITYDADALTLDLDNDGNNDSNYMPVGKDGSSFMGNFDGQGHTISGISVNANGMYRIGAFGRNDGTVKNLTVSGCLFAGSQRIGAIAGLNWGTVENCHLLDDVSVTGESSVGSVVGGNYGLVLGCTSVAKLSVKEHAIYFGGIAGYNSGTLTDNLFTGTIDGMPVGSWDIGAITGYNDTERGTLTNNFHTCSGMGGVGNDNDATNTDQAGAQLAYEFPTANGAMGNAGSTYGTGDYTGITAYEHGLAYNGKFYSPSPWGGSGTEDDPYIIVNTQGMDLLATNVNGGNYYKYTYFVLGNDIAYDANALTLDLDGDGNNDSNYMPVGKNGSSFYGNFDGQGHTISGIRVNANEMGYIGVFGSTAGTVKNLTVSGCLFAGNAYVSAIAGMNRGTVENCHLLDDVSVIGNSNVGGVVGNNNGSVLGCTSVAKLSAKEYARYFGGIAGYNSGTLTDNLFTGTIGEMPDGSWGIGAITGNNNTDYGTLTNNFHTCSGMGGVGNLNDATNTDQAGAQLAYEFPTANGAMGNTGNTYGTGGYTGITAYEHGLAYNGKFYSPSPWGGSGTAEAPYIIVNTQGMDKLATNVNGGNGYHDTYFVLGNDIVYAPDALTLDLDGDDNNDSNYMPVGNGTSSFYGNFDGQGHTISGIRVNANEMNYIGVFGINDGTVKNLMVSDCLFAGSYTVGAIAGLTRGTVENCHVAAYVSVTGNNTVGGVVSGNEGSVLGCTSAAALSAKEHAAYFGGIAGYNSGTLTDNLFTGTIDKMSNSSICIGAITGYHNTELGGMLTNNFHTCSGMGGVGNDNDATSTDVDGAQIAVSSNTKPDAATIGTAGTAYAAGETYEGITPYTHGLYYNGLYYYKDPNIVIWAGKGTAENPYVIRTTAELDLLATNVNGGNNYAGTYFELGADITYDGSENNYTPIGNTFCWFSGTFDGQGHTISGIRISETNGLHKAIFGCVDGTVKNLVVSDCRIEDHQIIGGIVALLYGTIENCHVGNDVTLSGNTQIGGIAGGIYMGAVKGCTSTATIIGTTDNGWNADLLGGIVGCVGESGDDTLTLTDNLFTGTISGDLRHYIGAIVGLNDSDAATLTNNYHACSGMGGVGNGNDVTGSDVAGALFAVSSDTEPDEATIGTAGTAYAAGETYEGITPYTHGLYYNGLYYYKDPNIAVWTGKGTEKDPYVIRTTAELDLLATNVNGGNNYAGTYFELGADITYDKSQENNFTPIGNNDYNFMGHFDGKGHKVSGLNIYLPENNHVGLFGFIYSGSVKNLTLTNSTIIGQQYVGSIAGQVVIGAAVENCHVTSDCDVNGDYCVGGIVGITDNCTIGGCTSAATVSGKQYVGGIVGSNNGSIKDCLYMGNVVSATPWAVGAIVGYNISDAATLINNYYTQSGVGGVNGIDEAGKAEFAVSSTTDPGNLGAPTTTYAKGESYQGITAYENGLYYNGRYYWHGTVRRGDANGDSVVNISDAVAIVNYILGKPLPAGFNEVAADMNGDGEVTITDAVMLVNMIGSQP